MTVQQGKITGAVTDRAALRRAIAAVQAGDVLLVTRIDRLARSRWMEEGADTFNNGVMKKGITKACEAIR